MKDGISIFKATGLVYLSLYSILEILLDYRADYFSSCTSCRGIEFYVSCCKYYPDR